MNEERWRAAQAAGSCRQAGSPCKPRLALCSLQAASPRAQHPLQCSGTAGILPTAAALAQKALGGPALCCGALLSHPASCSHPSGLAGSKFERPERRGETFRPCQPGARGCISALCCHTHTLFFPALVSLEPSASPWPACPVPPHLVLWPTSSPTPPPHRPPAGFSSLPSPETCLPAQVTPAALGMPLLGFWCGVAAPVNGTLGPGGAPLGPAGSFLSSPLSRRLVFPTPSFPLG